MSHVVYTNKASILLLQDKNDELSGQVIRFILMVLFSGTAWSFLIFLFYICSGIAEQLERNMVLGKEKSNRKRSKPYTSDKVIK